MGVAIVSGMVTGVVTVNYWPFFYLSQITVPEVFAKVDSALRELLPVSLVNNEEMSREFLSKVCKIKQVIFNLHAWTPSNNKEIVSFQ